MSETTFEHAQVGDRVWSPFGPKVKTGQTNGAISEFGWKEGGKSLWVKFDGGVDRTYWRTGQFSDTDSAPSLFWSRPQIIAPERPKRMKKVKVEVRPIQLGERVVLTVGFRDASDQTQFCGPVQFVEVEVWE